MHPRKNFGNQLKKIMAINTETENVPHLCGWNDIYGRPIYTHEYLDQLRDEDAQERKKHFIAAQRGGQEHILAANADIMITGGSRGGPLSIDTRVLTPDGYKRIGDITSDDIVFGPKGEQLKVVFNQYHGNLKCYKLTFTNGHSVIASADHTWKARLSSKHRWVNCYTSEIVECIELGYRVQVPQYKHKKYVSIINVEYVGMQECCCIHVDSKDMLFVLEGGIVTHNSKSFSILLDAVKDIIHPNFNAVILRHEKPDLENIIKDSRNVFKDFGYYVSSDRDMLWRLDSGGQVQFSYHAGDINDFKVRFQGKQFSYIAVDEITHIDWEKFLYLLTTLRNAHGIRNRFVGSCNPDKSSWVRLFIDWWIGNVDTIYADGKKHPELAGYPIPERDGKVRYCFMAGAAHISDIIWGDTREEVYEKCKDKIAELWTEDMNRFGDPKDLFIMSVAFVEAKITDNVKLLESDPSYIARLANQSQDQIMRDLRGNWDADQGSDEYLSEEDMQRFFANTKQYGDGIPRASLDVAFEGGDAAWMWLRVGNHIQDFVEFHLDAQNLIRAVDDQLHRWHVQPQNFTFDTNGIGQAFKGFFKRAVPFNNMEAPFGRDKEAQRQAKLEYDNLKSQTAFMFADEIKAGNISIEPYLLQKRITAKGIDNMTLHDVLMSQRRIIAVDQKKADTYKGKCIISKDAMKKMLHYSPDAMESLLYSHVFFVKALRPIYCRPTGSASYNFSSQRGGTIGYQHQGGAHVAARSRSRTRYC